MKAVFTVCTPSHMAEAKALMDSVKRFNPDVRCFIYLFNADAFAKEQMAGFSHAETLIVEELGLENYVEMKGRYNAFELSCALKPYLADHVLFHQNIEQAIYLDGDMMVTHSLESIWQDLSVKPLILTAHVSFNTIWPGDAIALKARRAIERNMLRGGAFNGGFFALQRNSGTKEFLAWWKHVLIDGGYNKPSKGLFTDQLWLVLVPVLYNHLLHISRNPGYNMAYWNLDERKLVNTDNGYQVTATDGSTAPLNFFHFSGYKLAQDNVISHYHVGQYTFELRPELKPLFDAYKKLLLAYDHDNIKARYAPPKKGWKRIFGK